MFFDISRAPSGKVFSEEELAEIAALCIKHDVIAVTDEIYEHIIFDGHKHTTLGKKRPLYTLALTPNIPCSHAPRAARVFSRGLSQPSFQVWPSAPS